MPRRETRLVCQHDTCKLRPSGTQPAAIYWKHHKQSYLFEEQEWWYLFFFPFCGPAASELFFSLPDMHGYKSRSEFLWVCFTSDISVGKKKSVSAAENAFDVRVNVLEFLRVKGVSFKSRVEKELEISCVWPSCAWFNKSTCPFFCGAPSWNLACMRRTRNPLIKRPRAGNQTSEMPCATATFWGFFLVKKNSTLRERRDFIRKTSSFKAGIPVAWKLWSSQ